MLAERRRQHERRPRAARTGSDRRLDEFEAVLAAAKLNVDEDHVHRKPGQDLACLADAGDRADYFGELGRLDELHQVVASRPFVLEHQRAQAGHEGPP